MTCTITGILRDAPAGLALICALTGLRCMRISSPFEAGRGYAIARCLINTVA